MAYVQRQGGSGFFHQVGWRNELFRVVAEHTREAGVRGRYETDAEYAARVRDEMAGEQADPRDEPRHPGGVSGLAVWRLHRHAAAVGDRGL